MDRVSEFLNQEKIAENLRKRWQTPEGEKVRATIIDRLKNHDDSWVELLSDFSTNPNINGLEDLRGLNLENEELNGVDLSFVDLSYGHLNRANLNRASLQGSNLSWADLSESKIVDADLLEITARHCLFVKTDLSGSMLLSSVFTGSYFHSAILKNATLDRANFTEVDFTAADLSNTKTLQTRFDRIIVSSDTKGLSIADTAKVAISHNDEVEAGVAQENLQDLHEVAQQFDPVARSVLNLWARDEAHNESLLNEAYAQLLGVWEPAFSGLSTSLYQRSAVSALHKKLSIPNTEQERYAVVYLTSRHGGTVINWPEIQMTRHFDQESITRLRNYVIHYDPNRNVSAGNKYSDEWALKMLTEMRKYFQSGQDLSSWTKSQDDNNEMAAG